MSTVASYHDNSSPNKIRKVSITSEDVSDSSERRSKFACIRCRKRKTKCSGEVPCRSCSASGIECKYFRKPKKITVLDTEIEEYESKIRLLTDELNRLKNSKFSEISSISISNMIKNNVNNDKLNLSIWLGSASCELICWNLKQFAKTNGNNSNIEEIIISPDFDSFIEEKGYDHLLTNLKSEPFTENLDPLNQALQGLTIEEVEQSFDNVVLFINSGYLTVNPIDFRIRIRNYFNLQGTFDSNLINNEKIDYFLIKMLMILSLGEIYSKKSCIGKFNKPFKAVPGSQYFKLVIKYLPTLFSLLNLTQNNVNDALEIIELFGLIAIYLRILDKKNASVLFTLNALQSCISLNLHKQSNLNLIRINEQHHISKIWWATYCLNRFYTSRIGQPLLLKPEEITIEYPKPPVYSPNNNNLSSPQSMDDFANSDAMKFYIDLAKISDKINNELYCLKIPFNNKEYLHSMLKILEILVDWVNNIPSYLRLTLPSSTNEIPISDENNRLIYTLHLNYLHHIYLTCIPILLHFAKIKILSFKKNKKNQPLNLNNLPRNISSLIVTCINSSQLTINIFMALYRERMVRSFGFVDLDYLFSSSLIFIICLILKIKLPNNQESYSFEEYLEVAMNLIFEMKLMGNLIAKGKLNQIIDLLNSLNDLFIESEYASLYENLKKYKSGSNNNNNNQSIHHDITSPITTTNNSTSNKSTINNLLNNFYSNSKSPNNNSPSTPGSNLASFKSITASPIFDLGINHLLDEFQIGRDIVDCTFLSTNNEYFLNSITKVNNSNDSSNVNNGSFNVTEEDILFMDQIMQDFNSNSFI